MKVELSNYSYLVYFPLNFAISNRLEETKQPVRSLLQKNNGDFWELIYPKQTNKQK